MTRKISKKKYRTHFLQKELKTDFIYFMYRFNLKFNDKDMNPNIFTKKVTDTFQYII